MIRLRIGIRLSWPIANAGTFVFKVDESQYRAGAKLVQNLRVWLQAVDQTEIAKRLIFEES